ncbi:MAG: antibiotic biosynthesis monooxygenase [Acidobacteria bacterium]|nr:antibiotic biosynthesis monooxygenase [Acidobacteriota bacterium]
MAHDWTLMRLLIGLTTYGYGAAMATILAQITVREGHEERFEQLASMLFEATHEHETGVERYEYWRGQEPQLYYALLAFVDYRAFLSHQTSEHHETVTAELNEVIASMKLEWVDPLAAASPLGPTNAQTIDDESSELERRYDAAMAPTIASWWEDLRG